MTDSTVDDGPLTRGPQRRSRRATTVWAVVGAASLGLLAPTLRAVYSELADLGQFDVRWLGAIGGCEALSFGCAWQLQRIVLRRDAWASVAAAQLAGNAVSQIVPAGGAAGAALQLRLLVESGVEVPNAVGGLTASAVLSNAGFLALPLIALPAIWTGSEIDSRVEAGIWLAFVALGLLVLTVVLSTRDRVLTVGVNVAERVVTFVRRGNRPTRLRGRVFAERDLLASTLRTRWALAAVVVFGRVFADYLALVCALVAAGARPSIVAALAAFAVANVAGMIPLTPGGLGFVEAGLTGMLVLNGVDRLDALEAAAVYRLAASWLPVLAGFAALAWFRVRRSDHHTRSELPPR